MVKNFPRRVEALEELFSFTGDFFAAEKIDPRHRGAVEFGLEEIFTNMIKYHPEGTHEISVRLDKLDDRLLVTLVDIDVDPFDPEEAAEPRLDLPLDQREIGGLGLHLTRKLMDDVAYEYDDRRRTIILTKKLE